MADTTSSHSETASDFPDKSKEEAMETEPLLVKESDRNDEHDSKVDKCHTDEDPSKISFKMPSLPVRKSDALKTADKQKKEVANVTKPLKQNNQNEEETKKSSKPEPKNEKMSELSPAEQLKQSQIAIPYKEPQWSGVPEEDYSFEVLKNGAIVSNIKLDKSFIVFGRLPSCDVTMEHPSLSRHHAVVQYCKHPTEEYQRGVYLYDLDSTHGTWINKNKVYPNKYYRIRVGHVVKFGGSTRLHILQGPDEDQEEESNLSVNEMKEQRERQLREAEFLRQAGLAEEQRQRDERVAKEEARGCLWGMGDDAEEDTEENPFASLITPESEALYIDDPKKALKGFFEREGYDPPEYDCQEASRGKYKCTVDLPVDTPTGEPMVAEAVVSGKKREAVLQCALEACRMLDKMGLLRASSHESRKRKKKNWEEDDFYDSDEDIFLDRTGDIEKKRQLRMKKAGKMEQKAETYDSLSQKHQEVKTQISEIEAKLEKAKAEAAALEAEEVDALDAYMSAIRSGVMDTSTRMKLKRQLIELKQEEQKLRRLMNVAKPASLPEMKPAQKTGLSSLASVRAKKFSVQKKPVIKFPSTVETKSDEEEEEEEDINDKNSAENRLPKTTQVTDIISHNEAPVGDRLSQNEIPIGEKEISEINKVSNMVKSSQLPSSADISTSKQSSNTSVVKGPTLPPTNVIKGPSLPPENQSVQSESNNLNKSGGDTGDTDNSEELKRKSNGGDKHVKVKKSRQKAPKVSGTGEYDPMDPDFAVWVPPKAYVTLTDLNSSDDQVKISSAQSGQFDSTLACGRGFTSQYDVTGGKNKGKHDVIRKKGAKACKVHVGIHFKLRSFTAEMSPVDDTRDVYTSMTILRNIKYALKCLEIET
ncbi:hypothetical protein FSP39_012127 [Pinctada imbricata]|uniref:FHA domain-containing protein n=1 Tax=Pinctada imbricata TaxID=66713 RepID=A0AA88XWG9_PINIB|nr:hypothetical protein FSP39_012127 [Pinctada imbricata]